MKRTIILIAFFIGTLLSAQVAWAQYDYEDEDLKPKEKKEKKESDTDADKPPNNKPDRKFDPSRMYVGGNFGAAFGSIIFVEVSPTVAYRIHERVDIGGGFTYQFINYKDYYAPYFTNYKTNIYGGRLFPRIYVWEQLFVQPEYLITNAAWLVESNGTNQYIERRNTYHDFLIGGGYNVPVGENAYFSIVMSVNLTTNYFPRRQPFFSFGFGVGL